MATPTTASRPDGGHHDCDGVNREQQHRAYFCQELPVITMDVQSPQRTASSGLATARLFLTSTPSIWPNVMGPAVAT
jgi:hypothetical protein